MKSFRYTNTSALLDDAFFLTNHILGEKFSCVLLVTKIGCLGKTTEGRLADKENIAILVNCEHEVHSPISAEHHTGIPFHNIVD